MNQPRSVGGLAPQYLNPATVPYTDEQGLSHVFSLPDVQRVTSDRAFGVDVLYAALHDLHLDFGGMWAYDGPPHDQLRSLVKDPFSPRVLQDLEPRIRTIARDRMAAISTLDQGTIEIVEDFAAPVAAEVICDLLGVDKAMGQQFALWLDEITAAPTPAQIPPQPDMVAYFRHFVEERRLHPQQHLADAVIAAQQRGYLVNGTPLSEWHIMSYLWVLIAAGMETTATTLGNAVLSFVEFGVWETLRNDRRLIPIALEESARWNPAQPAIVRMARQTLRLGDFEIAEGTPVLAWVSAANRDWHVNGTGRIGPDPQTFDIRRNPNGHLTFGHGAHSCLGAPLARIETRVALEVLLDRFPSLKRDPTIPAVYRPGFINSLVRAGFLC